MRFLEVDPRLLEPNPWNVNVVQHDNEIKLTESINRLGMFKPIICRTVGPQRLQILGGAHRVERAIELKMKTVPVIDLDVIDDAQAKEISLVDNARYGVDDGLRLAELIQELGIQNEIADFMPFADADVLSIMQGVEVNLDDLDLEVDEEPEAQTEMEERSKAVKTHEIMRFKVSIGDAEKLRRMFNDTMKSQNFTEADELSNAGDALVYLLLNGERSDA